MAKTTIYEATNHSRALKAARMVSNVGQADLIKGLGCSLATYIAKEKDPSKFTLAEFAYIYSHLNSLGKENAYRIITELLELEAKQ